MQLSQNMYGFDVFFQSKTCFILNHILHNFLQKKQVKYGISLVIFSIFPISPI